MTDSEIRELLDSQDWELIIKKATIHAIFQFKFWNIYSEKNIKGSSPEGIVMEAIEKVYSGIWKWNPEKSDFLNYLKYHVINGLISNFVTSKERSVSSSISDNPRDFEDTNNDEVKNIETKELVLIIKHHFKDDSRVLLLFEGLLDGLKRREICELNEWKTSYYDATLKRMSTLIKKNRIINLVKP